MLHVMSMSFIYVFLRFSRMMIMMMMMVVVVDFRWFSSCCISFGMFFVDRDILLYIIRGAQNYRSPLVDWVRLNVQNVHGSSCCHTSSLLHDKSHGVALIQQPQLQPNKRHETSDNNALKSDLFINANSNSLCVFFFHLALGALDISRVQENSSID